MKIVRIMGGLGNQMFQYAFFRAMLEKGQNVTIDLSWYSKPRAHNGYELKKIFNVLEVLADKGIASDLGEINYNIFHRIYYNFIKHKKTYYYQTVENAIIYDSTFYNLDNVYLSGYWQSEKYFSKSKDAIRKTYTFPQLTGTENLLAKDDILKSNSVSLHVRRGDYLKSKDLGGVCTTEYYKKAIDYISMKIDNPKFFIFSDDILWCENNLEVEDARYINFNKGKDSYQDMHLMSLCKHNIIANSSFSWWGAWLNNYNNKIVIAPNRWFNIKNSDSSDLIPENWIKIYY